MPEKPYKLFIPGPVEVAASTYAAMTTPVVGHRSADFVALYNDVQPGLQQLFGTRNPVFISTSSAWGVMEGAVRNLCRKKVLNCMSGAFSDKWHDVSLRCGFDAAELRFEWGHPVSPDALRAELAKGGYDCVTLIHNETSTGTMNPVAELLAVIREFPEVMSIVDCVSSLAAVPIQAAEWGADVVLAGSQKALALPPGMAVFTVSERALERAATVSGRGYYFDFLEFLSNHEKGMTPSTPSISLIYGLREVLQRIDQEGLEQRFARHEELNRMVHEWAARNGFSLFPSPPSYASKSLTCLNNDRGIDLAALNSALKKNYGCVIDTGYGKLKGKTMRISNMGNETAATIGELLANLDHLLAE